MLSLKLIRALGFATRDDFTKLVKSKNLKDRETLSKAISKYQIDHPKLVEDGEDEDDYHDYYDGGYVDSTNSCCGMAEIAECTNHPEEVMYRTFDAIRSGYRGVV